MDEIDSWLVALGLAGLGVATLLLAHALRALQEDVALLRITAAVPEIERHT